MLRRVLVVRAAPGARRRAVPVLQQDGRGGLVPVDGERELPLVRVRVRLGGLGLGLGFRIRVRV